MIGLDLAGFFRDDTAFPFAIKDHEDSQDDAISHFQFPSSKNVAGSLAH